MLCFCVCVCFFLMIFACIQYHCQDEQCEFSCGTEKYAVEHVLHLHYNQAKKERRYNQRNWAIAKFGMALTQDLQRSSFKRVRGI